MIFALTLQTRQPGDVGGWNVLEQPNLVPFALKIRQAAIFLNFCGFLTCQPYKPPISRLWDVGGSKS